jgi:uncharacterized membrane protein
VRVCVCVLIVCDQKVSVHLKITVHHQVHRDFLITLYNAVVSILVTLGVCES